MNSLSTLSLETLIRRLPHDGRLLGLVTVGEVARHHQHRLGAIDSRLQRQGYPCLLDAHERSYRVGAADRVVRQLLVADPDGYLIRLSELQP